jgi:hypothetical protein
MSTENASPVCPVCGARSRWVDDAWVCTRRSCGAEWYPDPTDVGERTTVDCPTCHGEGVEFLGDDDDIGDGCSGPCAGSGVISARPENPPSPSSPGAS